MDLSLGIVLSVIGIIFTLAFGVYSIWVAKKSNKKVSLAFERKECYSLFEKDINRLNIEIKYNDQPLDSYLVLFKGIITNNGKQDIDKNRIHSPLKIKTREDFHWLEANIFDKPSNSNVTVSKIDDSSIMLDWDLLKANEQIEFESLIKIPKNTELDDISDCFYNSITFDFRITDINQIEKTKITTKYERRKKMSRMYLFTGAFSVLMGLLLLISPYDIPSKSILSPYDPKFNVEFVIFNEQDEVNSSIKSTEEQTISFEKESEVIKMDIDEFNKKYSLRINKITLDKKAEKINQILGGIYVFMGCLIFFLFYLIRKKSNPSQKKKISEQEK